MRTARLFGKLPAHGDFVARGVAPDERGTLDEWLSRSLEDAKTAYGDDFDDLYVRTPPWRFVRQTDHGGIAAALALSVDGAGRRFPVYAERSGLNAEEPMTVAAAIEALLHRAIVEGWSVDAAMEALVAVDRESAGRDDLSSGNTPRSREGWWSVDCDDAALAEERPAHLVRHMLAGAAA